MAFFHSPTIPKENLQILMDFANPACYPGSGTSLSNLAVPGRNVGYIKNSVTNLTNKGFNILLFSTNIVSIFSSAKLCKNIPAGW